MTEWRREALEQVPELRSVVERETWSCHVFLFELLHLSRDAHRNGDDDVLRRAYGFALWCFEQPERFLSNAAMVSFYEHVFDDWELRQVVAPWLPAKVRDQVRPLWEWRLPDDRLQEVARLLGADDHRR